MLLVGCSFCAADDIIMVLCMMLCWNATLEKVRNGIGGKLCDAEDSGVNLKRTTRHAYDSMLVMSFESCSGAAMCAVSNEHSVRA